MSELAGKVALVTGGSRGIGQGIAVELARAGAAVAFTYNTSAAGAEETSKRIAETGGRALALACDVSSSEAVDALVAQVAAIYHASHRRTPQEDGRPDRWTQLIFCDITTPRGIDPAAVAGAADTGAADDGGSSAPVETEWAAACNAVTPNIEPLALGSAPWSSSRRTAALGPRIAAHTSASFSCFWFLAAP